MARLMILRLSSAVRTRLNLGLAANAGSMLPAVFLPSSCTDSATRFSGRRGPGGTAILQIPDSTTYYQCHGNAEQSCYSSPILCKAIMLTSSKFRYNQVFRFLPGDFSLQKPSISMDCFSWPPSEMLYLYLARTACAARYPAITEPAALDNAKSSNAR